MFLGILLEQRQDEWRMNSNVLDLPWWHNQDNRVIHRDDSWRDWSTIQATVLVRFLAELVWVVSRVESLLSVLLSSSFCRSSERPEEHLRISGSQYTPGLSGIFSDFPFEFWCICHADDISHREPRLVRSNLEENTQDRWRNDSPVRPAWRQTSMAISTSNASSLPLLVDGRFSFKPMNWAKRSIRSGCFV